jgi:hypothetical protein
VQPTMLTLLGLQNDYVPDGRVLIESLDPNAVPQSLRAHRETLVRLAAAYKQLNAPFGSFGMDTLTASTKAVASTDDATYTNTDNALAALLAKRDALAVQIRDALNAAAFDDQPLNERQAQGWIQQADEIVLAAKDLSLQP